MAQVVQLGAINTAALQVADVYVQIVPPQLLINGIPTNVVGTVGSSSWGPVGSPVIVGPYQDYVSQFGQMVPRQYDMGTQVYTASLQGGNAVFRCVRVTDGNDVAAAVTLQTNCLTVSSRYTGSDGNRQSVSIAPGSAAGSYRATVNFNPQVSEVFDNIFQGVQTLTVVPGTGYTSVPSLVASAPQAAPLYSPATARLRATLKLIAAPTVAVGGTGYVANDTITLSNGIVLTVATVTGGAVATITMANPGNLTAGAVPASPAAQVSTSGSGTGATFTLGAWGLGTAIIDDPGRGYTVIPTVTVVGGGGTGGTVTAAIAYWPNMASAINRGQFGLRGPSNFVVATAGVGISSPATATYQLVGGTDGANVNSATLIGVDVIPRKGMYALRSVGCSIGLLADVDDATTFPLQIAFGLGEGVYMIGTTPSGDSITNAVAIKASSGTDSYAFKLMLGDWVYILDVINGGIVRLVSPQGFVAGTLGNLAPNQSSLNKQMLGITGTQKSLTNIPYSLADLQVLAQNGIDVICNPIPRGSMFGCRNGRNTSSNQAIHGDNYTRMTNFIAFTIAGAIGLYVGNLQTADERRRAKVTLDSFFSNLQQQGLIGNASGTDAWETKLDDTNNPFSRVSLGYMQADVRVTYLSVIEFFLVNIEGGQTVYISRNTAPNPALL
jgi:hypothetical protein